jgi:predicted TIM-barrel fold metal-dependent hydrolase
MNSADLQKENLTPGAPTVSSHRYIVDAYSHISPPKYTEVLQKDYPGFYNNILGRCLPLYDMAHRFRIMDNYPGVVQVLTVGPVPSLESFANSEKSADLARLANDEMAELVSRHRDRFVAAIALLPMNNVSAALKEADRAIMELGFKGIYVHSNINGKPLDSPEFLPFFEMMARCNLPVYIHPWRDDSVAEYATEKTSKYAIASIFGWPYETTAAMTRLVFSGLFERFPSLKIVTHHCGGMVPYYEQRIVQHYGEHERSGTAPYLRMLSKSPVDYYKMFYNDTAIHGNTPALMLAYHFWGAEHIVFGADMPLGDHYFGFRSYRQTINAIEAMDIPEAEKRKIFSENAVRLLRLPI